MDIGARLRQERLARGLSQRQLCGDVITRNMLSQIENGTARPSMDTLVYLADRLEKPVSYFLEERTEISANQETMLQARQAFTAGQWERLGQLLCRYQGADEVWEPEYWLLQELWLLHRAETALREERWQYARTLLAEAEQAEKQTVYGMEVLRGRRILLLAQLDSTVSLPAVEDSLLLLARRALAEKQFSRSEALLESCGEKNSQWWQLYGETVMGLGQYEKAAQAFHRVETPELYGRLEECYRRMEDYRRAYEYACKQREK